jgi:antirestriction protein ArdC
MKTKYNQKTDIYQRVTDRIIERLKTVKASSIEMPWIRLKDSGLNRNPISGTIYQSINQFMLSIHGMFYNCTFNRWVTFKQAKQHNAQIRKGAKGCEIGYLNFQYFDKNGNKCKNQKQVASLTPIERVNQGISRIPFLRNYFVFNLGDVIGLPEEFYFTSQTPELSDFEKDERAERILDNTGATIYYIDQNRSFYNWSADEITLPNRKQFKGKVPFYNTAFHELAHWTGHETRLNRNMKGFTADKKAYAFEELVAELSTAFLCAWLGYESNINNNTAYIDSWLEALENDKKFVFSAAAKAQKAADFILKTEHKELLLAA